MALDNHGNLAIRETLKLAWRDVMSNWKPGLGLLLVIYVPGLLFNFFGFRPMMLPQDYMPSGSVVLLGIAMFLAFILFSFAIYVLFIRLFLVGPRHAFRISFKDLVLYALLFIWKAFLIGLLVMLGWLVLMIPLMIVGAIVSVIVGIGAEESTAPGASVMLLPALIIILEFAFYIVVLVRLYPSLFGTTIGQSIRFRESWRTMSGYTWRTVLALLPPLLIGWFPVFILWGRILPAIATGADSVVIIMSSMWWLWLLAVPFSAISYGWSVAILSQIYRDMWPAPDFLTTSPDTPEKPEDTV